jgi:hypothetical protein
MDSQARLSTTSLVNMSGAVEPFTFSQLFAPRSKDPTYISAHIAKVSVGIMCKSEQTCFL